MTEATREEGWKIAIVDDDFQVIRGLKKVIPWEELGAVFAGEAISGELGLELIQQEQPDIVITDLYMPGMNGIEMIEKLRNQGYEGSIIILSGYSDFEYARKALRLNVSDYISKPITIWQIRDVLKAVIQRMEESFLERIENSNLKKSLAAYEDMLLQEWLHCVISNTRNERSGALVDSSRLEQEWSEKNHAVFVMELIHNERIQGVSSSDLNLFKFAVANVTKELLAVHWQDSHYIQLSGYHFAILLHYQRYEEGAELSRKQTNLAESVIHALSQYLNVNVRIGIGSEKQHWNKVYQSTDEAFQALLLGQYRNNEADNNIYFYNAMKAKLAQPAVAQGQSNTELSSALPNSFHFYQRLSSAMAMFDEQKIMNEIRTYFQSLEEVNGHLPETFYRVFAAEIWALFHYSLYQSGAVVLGELDRTSMNEYNSINSWEQLEQWMESKVKLYCTSRSTPIHAKHKQAVDFMIEYIHENYHRDITLEELASQLYISKNYLNQIFKKVTGDTFMNYVISVRMQKAKALLLEGKHLVYEISEMVGYQNVPYFSTLFKKHCGVNPSELIKPSNTD